jgi:G3E family GTPase
MMHKQPIPVHILTGFLGSGKTTLLNHLVRSPQFSNTFVIINEFGAVGIDHLLVKSTSETMIEMSSGCICCTIQSDLKQTLKDILWRFSRNGSRQFDRVIIETTGLADPAPIIHTIMSSPELEGDYELSSVIATIDCTCFANTYTSQFEVQKQAAVADSLILTKTDLVEKTERLEIEEFVRSVNPAAPIFTASNGKVDSDKLFQARPFSIQYKTEDVKGWLNEEAYRDNHNGYHDHHHDINRHGKDISAFCITREEPISEKAFTIWSEFLLKFMGEGVLRMKGIVNIDEYDTPLIVQGVQHIMYPTYQLEAWPDSDRSTRLVFITRGVTKESLESSLKSLAVSKEKLKVQRSIKEKQVPGNT